MSEIHSERKKKQKKKRHNHVFKFVNSQELYRFLSFQWGKKQVFSSIPALGFRPLLEYRNRCDGISRCRWASSEFPKCRQRNHYSCYKFKSQFLHGKYLTFHSFSKEHYKHNNQDKKLRKECHAFLRNFHISKKGKIPDKVSCVKERKNC